MAQEFDLNVASPEQVAAVLRKAAWQFEVDRERLAGDWQDRSAGRIWAGLAKVLERAANQCERACKKEGW